MKKVFYRFCNVLWGVSYILIFIAIGAFISEIIDSDNCSNRQKEIDNTYSIEYKNYENKVAEFSKWRKEQSNKVNDDELLKLMENYKPLPEKPEKENLYCSGPRMDATFILLMASSFIFLFLYIFTGTILKRPKINV